MKLAVRAGDFNELTECFDGSYLDSDIKAAIHWDNITRDLWQPRDAIAAAVMRDLTSHFHSKDERMAKYATRALEIVVSQTESVMGFERNFKMRG
jgi:hypothetical protein